MRQASCHSSLRASPGPCEAVFVTGNPDGSSYLTKMLCNYLPCLPTRATKVPAGPDWLHEIKYDGYRLIVERDGQHVRLFTRSGHDWTKRYPWIVEAALKNRIKQFVIDGEAVILGVDGVSDFNALHSGKHNDEGAFDALSIYGDDLRSLPLGRAKPISPGYLIAGRTAFSLRRSNKARSARTCFGRPATWDWRGWFQSAARAGIARGARRTGSRSRTGNIRRCTGCKRLMPNDGA